jgi:hypothetical protein
VRRSTDERPMRRPAELQRTADIQPASGALERRLSDLDRCIGELEAAIADSASTDDGIVAVNLASAESMLRALAEKIRQRRTTLIENTSTHRA